jgi:PAS domain S-box-containing protein
LIQFPDKTRGAFGIGLADPLECGMVGSHSAPESQLVVIGSSAGGIEALSRVVASLPADFPAPIVIAQHLDPRRPSHLGEILARHATLPIKVVEDSASLEDGVIFVVPSNRLVEIVDHDMRLRPATPGSVAPSVDLLLESAATAYGSGLTAVILTGTGSDGSAGAWQVKKAGGTVVIENPATALFSSMPRSISPSLVDSSADLDSIGGVLRDLMAVGSSSPRGREGREFAELLDRVRERSGIDFSTYKPATIVRRLRGRMGATGQASIGAYARKLDTDAEEYARLISSLLIKVTEFFRDPKVFDHLRDQTMPMLIDEARTSGRPLRLWSAGCSTGEEAYSLAITLAEAMGDDPPPHRRVAGPPALPLSMAKPLRVHREAEIPLDRAIRATRRDAQLAADSTEAAESLLLDLGLGVVVVDARYYINRINTAARRMLGIHGLAFDQDFIHLAESLPSGAIRTAIDAALGGKATKAVHEVEAADVAAGGARYLETVIRPYVRRPEAIDGAVIELTDMSRTEHERASATRTDRQLERATAINHRLLRANEELTALVAQLRLANQSMLESSEEAQSGREEVETLNEEFQATNEELETLNEELTASVEELRVANEDLAARTDELRLQTVALEEQKQHGQEEHNRLQSVLASLGDAVVAVDRQGEDLLTNPAYDRLFGGADNTVEPEDLAGLPLPHAEWPQQRAARGERFRMEFAVSDADGSRRWFEAVTEPLTSQDPTWGGVVAIRDVSERTMRLSLERLMAAAGHELKTPTAAIHNYLQLVERHLGSGETDKAATYADRALAQTRRLATLIERLLDVSRIQTGQLELLLDVVDLSAVVRSVVDVAQVLPKAPPIRLTTGRRSVPVRADPGRLEQVFLNLLANAMEHAPGSGEIDVAVRTAGGHAVVTVRDHGPGIAPEHIRSMFDAYTRLGQPHRAPGLGLGLYVAREIVIAHGGDIEATSKVGSGTVMTVRLPLADRRARSRGPAKRDEA